MGKSAFPGPPASLDKPDAFGPRNCGHSSEADDDHPVKTRAVSVRAKIAFLRFVKGASSADHDTKRHGVSPGETPELRVSSRGLVNLFRKAIQRAFCTHVNFSVGDGRRGEDLI